MSAYCVRDAAPSKGGVRPEPREPALAPGEFLFFWGALKNEGVRVHCGVTRTSVPWTAMKPGWGSEAAREQGLFGDRRTYYGRGASEQSPEWSTGQEAQRWE